MGIYFDAPVWLIGLLILAIVLIILRRRQCNPGFMVCFAIFWIYLLLVIKITLFPIEIVAERVAVYRNQGVTILSSMNLTPFFFGRFATAESIFWAVSQNILLTMPFGFGINFLAGNKPGKLIWLTLIGGLGIEFTQLLIMLGYPYRVVDVNDAISNATGVVMGYICFILFARIYVRVAEQTSNLQMGRLASYLYSVTRAAQVVSKK
jgi:glycopeptide antibiotics resistance protein